MAITRRLARPLLASAFVAGGATILRDPSGAAVRARSLTHKIGPALTKRSVPVPTDPLTLVRATAAVQVGAALALATGRAPRTSATILIITLVPSTLLNHPFWAAATAEERSHDLSETARNAALAGGLILAAVDTEGKPGVAWRTRRTARDAKREARHLARTARLEAKLAIKNVGAATR